VASDPRPDTSAKGEKAERRCSRGRRHSWEPGTMRQGDIILKSPAQRRIFRGAVAVFGPATGVLADS
jgi:hypothetical protein